MALTRITQPRQKVKGGRESGGKMGRNIGAGLGAIVGGVAGGLAGAPGGPGTIALGASKGAIQGAATGGGVGSIAGEMIQPGQEARVEQQAGAVPLTAMQESQRGQQLLTGLKVARNDPELSEYAAPLTKAYVQNRINLHKMG